MKSLKKYFLISCIFILSAMVFAEGSFVNLSMVSFTKGLEYEEGEDTQAYTVKRQLAPFAMNKYETTYSLWYQVRQKAQEEYGYVFANPGQGGTEGKRGRKPGDENKYQPVTMINWYDAIIWCNALSELKGKTPCYTYDGEVLRDSYDTATCDLCECDFSADGYRLPTEAEWEYAARRLKKGFQKGNLVSGDLSENGDSSLLYGWNSENADTTRIVGTAGIPFDTTGIAEPATGNANGAGLYDMCGNVLEFCWDWFGDYAEDKPYGVDNGSERVSRGGSWSPYTMFTYAGDRYSFDPNEFYDYFGFRICCTIVEQ